MVTVQPHGIADGTVHPAPAAVVFHITAINVPSN